MSQDEKIDLSPLDPSRDPARWEAMIDGIVTRALAARRGPQTLGAGLRAWGRPALALAAALALAVWLAGLWRGDATTTSATLEPTTALTTWAHNDVIPSTGTILEVFGE